VAEWIAYAELEPFGAVHESKLFGMVCATVGNFSVLEGKDEDTGKRRYWVPEDFVPNPLVEPKVIEKKKQTPEEMAAALKSAFGSRKSKQRRKK